MTTINEYLSHKQELEFLPSVKNKDPYFFEVDTLLPDEVRSMVSVANHSRRLNALMIYL